MFPETLPALKNDVLFPVLIKSCCAVTTKSHNVPELLSNSQSRSPSPLMVTPELMVTSALLPLMSKSAQLEENDATVPLTSLQASGEATVPDVVIRLLEDNPLITES